jgi:hypothetical protein
MELNRNPFVELNPFVVIFVVLLIDSEVQRANKKVMHLWFQPATNQVYVV